MQRTAKGLAGQSGFVRRPAKGTAASTSSQPQAVMDSSADTSAPLASQLAETRAWGALVETVFSKAHALQQRQPKQSGNQHEPKRTGSGCPHRRSGSEADSMSRGGYPVAGRPSSESSSVGHIPSNEAVFHQAQAFNEVVLTRTTPDRNQSAPGAGTPTGDFWKRSGQHEPRRVPGHGAPPIEAVFHQAQAFNEAVFRQARPFLFSRWTCPT